MSDIFINPQLSIPAAQLTWTFSRSSGPGGQNVNKVNTKATLRWVPPQDFLPEAAWRRFLRKATRYVTEDGEIVIQSQENRDRAANIEACTQKLKDLIRLSLVAPKKRIATKPSKAAKARRLNEKKLRSDKKSGRKGGWE
ncbi:MAG: alternative ribosome rescue aminoacyl-tRNA hydrolase ArfB [Pirellulales bacterium]